MSEFSMGVGQSKWSNITELQSSRPTAPTRQQDESAPSSKSFLDLLQDTLQDANEAQKTADQTAQKFAGGENIELHEVMIAMEKADIALRTVTAFRGKLVEAYQEIMRMPV